MHRNHLITLVDTYAARVRRSDATLSNKIIRSARLFSRLRRGEGCTMRSYEAALTWFDANWPADLPWPVDVPRPKQKKDAA